MKGGTFDRHENAEQICSIEGIYVLCRHLSCIIAIHTGTTTQHFSFIVAGPYIGHMATTSGGSGGSPLLREYNNELIVIGLHRGDLALGGYAYTKIATLITVIVADVQMKYYDDNNCK